MQLTERINAFAKLSEVINENNAELQKEIGKAKNLNPWFTDVSIWDALNAIKYNFLNAEKLSTWLKMYEFNADAQKAVGLILAGNIPLVGFHDILCVLLAGHKCLIKYSDKDQVLIAYLLDELVRIEPRFDQQIESQERLKGFDIVIATGSNNTGKFFEKYFSHVPNLIRKNRNAVGVIFNDVDDVELSKIGSDIFQYYGLGCRNISKVYIEDSFKIDRLFEAVYSWKDVINHNKYKNNYDYSNALFLLNSEKFLTNNFLILRPHEGISSRIATVNFEYFSDENILKSNLKANSEKIQCIVSSKPIADLNTFSLGQAQSPALNDYADGVDTMAFLKNI